MTDALEVRLFDRPVGALAIAGGLRSPEDWRFTYAPDYAAMAAAPPLSVSLPVRPQPFEGAVARNWFSNLLPEGAVRDTIERRLRIPARDDFALLSAIGGECAGAVSVGPPPRAQSMEPAETDLETLLYLQGDDAGDGAWAALGTPFRLSLAGAQDKIAVVRAPDGRLRLPQRSEPSTHILKPESRNIAGLRDLEALGLRLARAIGLDAAPAELLDVAGRNALLIERYDRRLQPDGSRIRLHQEDFCQAMGLPGELKYESQGGPSLSSCAALIRDTLRLGPAALQGFLNWVVYNVVIGNADAHAKNLSLLRPPGGPLSLAPLYDLVPTLAIAETLLDRTPALDIGGAPRIDAVDREHWQRFARAAGYAPNFVCQRVATVAEAVIEHLPRLVGELVDHGADAARLQRTLRVITDTARATADRAGG